VESGTEAADSDSGTISARYPVIEVQRLVTEFSMSSGATAVIGGLSRTVEEQVDNGIPLLRDIPWIGPKLFGSMVRKKQQKEIIVFVTVGLVNPNEMLKDAGLPKNAVLGRQYTKGQKLEPGDRPEKNLEGIGSLDLRSLEEQAQDPLPPPYSGSAQWIPFINDKKQQKDNNK
jgi:type II secretory pathway component GspD/PulD (secretin)